MITPTNHEVRKESAVSEQDRPEGIDTVIGVNIVADGAKVIKDLATESGRRTTCVKSRHQVMP